jgi:L-amino acid N-acyltransferase YncA
MSGYLVEPMVAADWSQVCQIYLEGIATGHATFETEAPSWSDWDRGHLAAGRLVARAAGTIAGWAALSAVSERCVYAGVAETSVYVADRYRGRGVGRALLAALLPLAENQGIWTLQAGIFPENLGSLRLHEALGFRVVGRRERIGKLRGVWRDTLLLERRSVTDEADAPSAAHAAGDAVRGAGTRLSDSTPSPQPPLMRIWTTRVAAGRESEYLAFAQTRSRPMFLTQPGCLGVLFLKMDSGEHAACSFWSGRRELTSLATSARYQQTVADLERTAALVGDARVAVYEIEGGAVDGRRLAELIVRAAPPEDET